MQLLDPATRERLLERLAQRAVKRGSAASRGEVSMLAGVGILIWAFLTVTVLVSTPQALPLDPRQTSLSVGAGSGPGRLELEGAGAEARATSDVTPSAVVAAGPPAESTGAPSATAPATASPLPKATQPAAARAATAEASATRAPSATSPATPAPTVVTPAPPTPAVVALAPAPPVPSAAPPTSTVTPAATPTVTPTTTPTPVQVIGANGAVLTGPRGGPLNTQGADLYSCGDFVSLEQLIAVFIASGPSDPNHLDPLRTGSPCPPEDEVVVE